MIRSFGESIFTSKININKDEMGQSNLLENMVKFNDKYRPKNKEDKDRQRNTYESAYAFYEDRELTLNAFTNGIIHIKNARERTSLERSYATENVNS